jgi:hypothetical protein
MPSKSRRKRGKNLPPSKRIKRSGSNVSAAKVSQPPESKAESAEAVKTPVMPEKKSIPQVQTTSARYPYISSELRTIGILAVVVLVFLGILAATL